MAAFLFLTLIFHTFIGFFTMCITKRKLCGPKGKKYCGIFNVLILLTIAFFGLFFLILGSKDIFGEFSKHCWKDVDNFYDGNWKFTLGLLIIIYCWMGTIVLAIALGCLTKERKCYDLFMCLWQPAIYLADLEESETMND